DILYAGRFGFGSTSVDMEDMNDLLLPDLLHPSTPVVAVPGGNDDFRVTCGTAGLPVFGKLEVTLKGGDGSDNLQILTQGELHRAVNLVLDGGDGADTLSADMALDAGSNAAVNATVLGG